MNYTEFLQHKTFVAQPTGLSEIPELHPGLFPFQSDVVAWGLKRGRAAFFEGCGLGKTFQQLEWARHIPGNVLILAPLAVASQTVREGVRFGINVNLCRKQDDVVPGINITNYEMLDHFDPSAFVGVVLDESSILKSYDGKTRTRIIDAFKDTQFKLACSATPAPNDYMELGNHSEFLGVMSRVEMLSMFFVHDGGATQDWRLKGHAEQDFWRWLASWAVMIRKPSDLGYDDGAFQLPPLRMHEHVIRVDTPTAGNLFALEAVTLQERIAARRDSVEERVAKAVELVDVYEPCIIWCNLNSEQEALEKAFGDQAISVYGSLSHEEKERRILSWLNDEKPILISKVKVCGYGLNFQRASNMLFVGLSDSWEQFYQAVRRSWRFGQDEAVDVHLIVADTEGAVLKNIKAKEVAANLMAENIVVHMRDQMAANIRGSVRVMDTYKRDVRNGNNWTMHLGDSVEIIKDVPSDSVHFSCFSPPFSSLYTYSASDRDMGNCKDLEEFTAHFEFLTRELYRVLIPGRLVSFHCMNLPTSKVRDGVIGIQDFRGDLIRLFEAAGFIFHSEVVIWKDPVTAMQRTKALGLLYKQLKKDSAMSRQGIPDYLVTMRKPGENPERITKTELSFPVDVWQRYASPVWMDINPSDTLQFRSAREQNDERHICPLQLQVIERAIELWTNPGDTVLSPFGGIGSEGYVALQKGRKFLGMELKHSYWKQSCANLELAKMSMGGLFDEVAIND